MHKILDVSEFEFRLDWTTDELAGIECLKNCHTLKMGKCCVFHFEFDHHRNGGNKNRR